MSDQVNPYSNDMWAGDTVQMSDGRVAVVLSVWVDNSGLVTLLVDDRVRVVVPVSDVTVLVRHVWDGL